MIVCGCSICLTGLSKGANSLAYSSRSCNILKYGIVRETNRRGLDNQPPFSSTIVLPKQIILTLKMLQMVVYWQGLRDCHLKDYPAYYRLIYNSNSSHNPKVRGSNSLPATKLYSLRTTRTMSSSSYACLKSYFRARPSIRELFFRISIQSVVRPVCFAISIQ